MRAVGDRRQQPRRSEETAMHYARENLLQAALTLAERGSLDDLVQLNHAATTYRRAERELAATTS